MQLSEEQIRHLDELVTACEQDFGTMEEFGDDEAVASGDRGDSPITFGHIRRARAAIHAVPFQPETAQLSAVWSAQALWSQLTFGNDTVRGPVGPLKHLEREAKEAYEHPSDRSEYADCLLLIMDAARRAGMSLADLVDEAARKLAINQQRTWEKPTTDEPVFHQK